MAMEGKADKREVIKFAGAFIAWVIGSGFATGQEIVQFFASYAYLSYAVVVLNLLGFMFLGQRLLITGYRNRDDESFQHFKYFCGDKLGKFYSFLIPITIILIMSVLISGVGATLSEYFNINKYMGSALMMTMVLCAYLLGFEKLVRLISTVGPIIIIFSLLVGVATIATDYHNFTDILKYRAMLGELQAAPHWTISSLLYLSLNFLSGSSYFSNLGRSAKREKDAIYGALLGAAAVGLTIGIMNTALLLNVGHIINLEVPVAHLARNISFLLGNVFSIVLVLGMFSSASAMMWSVCHRFKKGDKKGNQIFAVLVAILTFILSLFSFSELMGIFYPLVGYVGIIFIAGIIYRRTEDKGQELGKN
mgnify:CR=1 FL=1